jgi:copper chaperone CopZ
MLWASTVIVAAFIFFPSYLGVFLKSGGSSARASAAVIDAQAGQEYIFDVEGMHCEGCAVTLRNELTKLDGVLEVGVDYASKTARVRATGERAADRVAAATSRAGYSAKVRSER